uniref:Uncharacterized protein n=2 Tax=Panagrolaimus sp. PS1159 TaxID=55785 RepID=A0AC35FLV7_9BILA
MQNKYFNVTCQRGRIHVLNCVTDRGTVLPVGTLPFIEDGIKYTCDPVEDSLDPDYPENPFEGSGETEIVGDCENGNLEYEFQGFLVSCISNKILGCVNPKGRLIQEGYFVVKDKQLKFCKVYANGRKARIENKGCFNGSLIDSPADEIYHVPKYTIWTEGRLQLRCGDNGIQVYKCPLKDGKTIHTGSAWLDENNVLNVCR